MVRVKHEYLATPEDDRDDLPWVTDVLIKYFTEGYTLAKEEYPATLDRLTFQTLKCHAHEEDNNKMFMDSGCRNSQPMAQALPPRRAGPDRPLFPDPRFAASASRLPRPRPPGSRRPVFRRSVLGSQLLAPAPERPEVFRVTRAPSAHRRLALPTVG